MSRISYRQHRFAVTAAALLALGGCSGNKDSDDNAAVTLPSGTTLAEAISSDGDLSTVAGALRNAGLSQVFDGAGSYTILAPTDEAFAKLGDAGKALTQDDDDAAMTAVLRDHIVPGYLTPADIESAIDAQGGQVKVETMGDHPLKFTREGASLRVTGDDGSTALVTGDVLKASNGVAIPLDAVLKNLEPNG